MVVIRGKVEPGQVGNGNGGLRSFLGLARWKLEYTVVDRSGTVVEKGTFKADSNGTFVLGLNVPTPGIVGIRVLGGSAYKDDYCTVDVSFDNDLINLPRKLTPA